eukprot:Skav220386  [mRNA]  locus=scaffold639:137675:144114:- [translate_table: standard]
MPLIAMFMKAEMEGVERIVFPEEDSWKVDIQQSGGTELREGVTIDPTNEEDIPNSKGTANFLIKWDGAKARHCINDFGCDTFQVYPFKGQGGEGQGPVPILRRRHHAAGGDF